MEAHYQHAQHVPLRRRNWSANICAVRFAAAPEVQEPLRFLLIHGNPSYVGDWSRTVPALRQLGEVVAFDQAGFGRSPALAGAEPSLANYAELAVALADELGWRRCVVIGQSHGGLVACSIAARYPERVAAVILLCTAGTPAHPAYQLLGRSWVRRGLHRVGSALLRRRDARPLTRLVAELTVRNVYAPDPVPADTAAQQLAFFGANSHVLDSIGAVAQGDPCAEVARNARHIRAPVLFVHGTQDRLVPIAFARRLYEVTRQATNADFVALPGGHMVHYCRPELVNGVLVDWLQRTTVPSAFAGTGDLRRTGPEG